MQIVIRITDKIDALSFNKTEMTIHYNISSQKSVHNNFVGNITEREVKTTLLWWR